MTVRQCSVFAVVLVATLAGCSGQTGVPPTTTAPPSSTMTSAPSPNEQASIGAERVLRQFYATIDALRKDHSLPVSRLADVAASTELSAYQRLIKSERKQGVHQVGETRIGQLEVQAVDLDNSAPTAGKVPTVQIDACLDVTDTDVVDDEGASVIEPGRADTGWVRHTLVNYEWNDDPESGWRVATSQDIEREPCDA